MSVLERKSLGKGDWGNGNDFYLEIVDGVDVAKSYHRQSEGLESCMSGMRCVYFYAAVKDMRAIRIVRSNRVYSRALLWTVREVENPKAAPLRYVDQHYYDSHVSIGGQYLSTIFNREWKLYADLRGANRRLRAEVIGDGYPLTRTTPYIDTFMWSDHNQKYFYNGCMPHTCNFHKDFGRAGHNYIRCVNYHERLAKNLQKEVRSLVPEKVRCQMTA